MFSNDALSILESVGWAYLPNKYNGVDKFQTMEPFDKKIIAKLSGKYNIYHKVVLIMKLATQESYNMGMILGIDIW